jgi:hypothetical protein
MRWKKLPFEKTLNACVISTHFQPLVPLSVGKCRFSGHFMLVPKATDFIFDLLLTVLQARMQVIMSILYPRYGYKLLGNNRSDFRCGEFQK